MLRPVGWSMLVLDVLRLAWLWSAALLRLDVMWHRTWRIFSFFGPVAGFFGPVAGRSGCHRLALVAWSCSSDQPAARVRWEPAGWPERPTSDDRT
jgi:hypothetical protein